MSRRPHWDSVLSPLFCCSQELEFSNLFAVLHCIHAFFAAKVACLDPMFVGSQNAATAAAAAVNTITSVCSTMPASKIKYTTWQKQDIFQFSKDCSDVYRPPGGSQQEYENISQKYKLHEPCFSPHSSAGSEGSEPFQGSSRTGHCIKMLAKVKNIMVLLQTFTALFEFLAIYGNMKSFARDLVTLWWRNEVTR